MFDLDRVENNFTFPSLKDESSANGQLSRKYSMKIRTWSTTQTGLKKEMLKFRLRELQNKELHDKKPYSLIDIVDIYSKLVIPSDYGDRWISRITYIINPLVEFLT